MATKTLDTTYPIPSGDTFEMNGRTYRFCGHCHGAKPLDQIPAEGKNAGICIYCTNGLLNYDRLAIKGIIPPRPGGPGPKPAPAPKPKKPAATKPAPKATKQAKTAKKAAVKAKVTKKAEVAIEELPQELAAETTQDQ